jgi:hypothetical protein
MLDDTGGRLVLRIASRLEKHYENHSAAWQFAMLFMSLKLNLHMKMPDNARRRCV